jgi:hypothetical protein
MSTAKEERALVTRLGKSQIAKLAIHSDNREHWREWGEDDFYVRRMNQEIGELLAAIAHHESPHRVWNEAADVANFAAMLADRYENRAEPAEQPAEKGDS